MPTDELDSLPPPRSEQPTLPDRPSDAPKRDRASQGAVALSAGTFDLPVALHRERKSLELVLEGEEDDQEASARGRSDELRSPEPPTLRFGADEVWNAVVEGPPTPRADRAVLDRVVKLSRADDAELGDADDDDRTDPAVPSARRLSDRAPRPSTPPTAKSVPPPGESAPPPVSVTVSPTDYDRTAPGIAQRPRSSGEESGSGTRPMMWGAFVFGGLLLAGAGALHLRAAAAQNESSASGALPAFNRAAAERALTAAAAQTTDCPAALGAKGSETVAVTFEPTSGAVADVKLVDPARAGTAAGVCISRALGGASVPPFRGSSVTIPFTVAR